MHPETPSRISIYTDSIPSSPAPLSPYKPHRLEGSSGFLYPGLEQAEVIQRLCRYASGSGMDIGQKDVQELLHHLKLILSSKPNISQPKPQLCQACQIEIYGHWNPDAAENLEHLNYLLELGQSQTSEENIRGKWCQKRNGSRG